MKSLSIKKYVTLIVIGFLLVILDINVYTGIKYPAEYKNSDSVIGEFQYYNIKSTYGATCNYKLLEATNADSANTYQGSQVIDDVFFGNIRIDIFNDFIGYFLIAFSCLMLSHAGKSFKISTVFALISFILHGVICALPFIFNGVALCNIVMILNIAYIGCGILTTFMFTNSFIKLFPDTCCRDERLWLNTAWFVSAILQVLTSFIFWLGSDMLSLFNLGIFFEVVLVCNVIIYWLFLKRVFDYMQKNYDKIISH